jgi:hypothetical protein
METNLANRHLPLARLRPGHLVESRREDSPKASGAETSPAARARALACQEQLILCVRLPEASVQ